MIICGFVSINIETMIVMQLYELLVKG